MTEKYDVYGAEPTQDDLPWELREGSDDREGRTMPALGGVTEAGPDGGWCVLVEYTNNIYDKPPTTIEVLDDDIATHEEARVVARQRAFGF